MPTIKSLLNKDYAPPNLDTLEHITYAINCVDQVGGKIGSFAYDEQMYNTTGTMWAVSPVFDYVDDLFSWARSQGFTEHPNDSMFCIKRKR